MPRAVRQPIFHREFREDLRFWVATDRKVALRALDLVEAVLRDPFQGVGKPEPLKYLAPGLCQASRSDGVSARPTRTTVNTASTSSTATA